MGKKRFRYQLFFIIVFLLFNFLFSSEFADESIPEGERDSQPEALSGWLYTQDNKIYSSDGKVWLGTGANIHDTRGCNACTWEPPDVDEVKRRIDELVDVWGADFLRLCMESYGTAEGRTHWKDVLKDSQYRSHIQEIVDYIGTKPGVYVLLSVWYDPSLTDLGWPTNRTLKIWKKLAKMFKNDSHVLYGIANEPEENWSGSLDKKCWLAMNKTVKAIRQLEKKLGTPNHIIAVQGTRAWARRLDYYITHPITAGGGKNVVYETHVYNPESDFNDLFITPAKTLPVIIGEFGPISGYMTNNDCIKLMKKAKKLKIPHLAWSFHMRCPPNLLMDNSNGGCGIDMKLKPTDWGKLLKKYLKDDVVEIILYDGEEVPYSNGSGWDQNGSTISESTASPKSGTNHIRCNINVNNWWGAVAYAPYNWQSGNWKKASELSLYMKANKAVDVYIQIVDSEENTSNHEQISVKKKYRKFEIILSNYTGINLREITCIVFALSVDGSPSYIVDIDDIKLLY